MFEACDPFGLTTFDEFFFFKQKTAYEILACWSSDVCSSDLRQERSDQGESHRAHHNFRIKLTVRWHFHETRPLFSEQRPVPEPSEQETGHDGGDYRCVMDVNLWGHNSSYEK